MCSKKIEDLNLSFFDMIMGINGSKILTKHISCELKCKFDGKKFNSNQKWNNDKHLCECKNLKEHNAYEKDFIWNSNTFIFENGESLRSFIDDSVIMSDETVNPADNVSKNGSVNVWALCQ